MQELKHALTGGIYGVDPEDGLVRVEEAGKVGWIDYRGRWQRGDVFQADPELFVYDIADMSSRARTRDSASRPR